MPSVMDLALCADAVYDKNVLKVGPWMRSSSVYGSNTRGFFASSYAHSNGKELIIAFRGTDDLSDVATDANIFLGKYPNQAVYAYDALKDILTKNKHVKTIYLTGHSLGGGLASLMGSVSDLPTVTFNAPGMSRSIIPDWIPSGIESIMARGISKFTSVQNILHIRTNFDVISIGAGPKIGKIHNVSGACSAEIDSPDESKFVKSSIPVGLAIKFWTVIGSYTLCQHKMTNIINALRKNRLYSESVNFSRF